MLVGWVFNRMLFSATLFYLLMQPNVRRRHTEILSRQIFSLGKCTWDTISFPMVALQIEVVPHFGQSFAMSFCNIARIVQISSLFAGCASFFFVSNYDLWQHGRTTLACGTIFVGESFFCFIGFTCFLMVATQQSTVVPWIFVQSDGFNCSDVLHKYSHGWDPLWNWLAIPAGCWCWLHYSLQYFCNGFSNLFDRRAACKCISYRQDVLPRANDCVSIIVLWFLFYLVSKTADIQSK